MAQLTIVTWLWGGKYGKHYVDRLSAGLRRHLRQPYQFIVAAPEPDDEYLTKIDGCMARLRMFDPVWQAKHGIERLVCIDLDVVITGELDPLFDRPETFVILQGANSSNPCPYNGSLMMLRAGCHAEVWRDFTLDKAKVIPFDSYPDDQEWLAHKLPNAAGWKAGPQSGVYAFQKPGWPGGEVLPADARIVAFPGKRDPAQYRHLSWVAKHWRA